jgi:hypothetical protein
MEPSRLKNGLPIDRNVLKKYLKIFYLIPTLHSGEEEKQKQPIARVEPTSFLMVMKSISKFLVFEMRRIFR